MVHHDCGSRAVSGAAEPGGKAVPGMVWVRREEGALGKVVSAAALASALRVPFGV